MKICLESSHKMVGMIQKNIVKVLTFEKLDFNSNFCKGCDTYFIIYIENYDLIEQMKTMI